MKITILLSELLKSEKFLDGNELFSRGGVLLTEFSQKDDTIHISGGLKAVDDSHISLEISQDGKVVSHECSIDNTDFCDHVVALALKFNELSIEEESPLKQLREIIPKSLTYHPKEMQHINITQKGSINFSQISDQEILRVMHTLPQDLHPLLLSIFIERITINGQQIIRSTSPAEVTYNLDDQKLSFYLPDYCYFYEEAGILFNSEKNSVTVLDHEHVRAIKTLLAFSVSYKDKNELIPIIHHVKKMVSEVFRVSGILDVEHSLLTDTNLIFDLDFNKKHVLMKIYFEEDGHEHLFMPKRKDSEQTYSHNERLYIFQPVLLKKIRAIIKDAQFRLSRDNYITALHNLPSLIEENGILKKNGIIRLQRNVEELKLDREDIDASSIKLSIEPEKGWFSFTVTLPEAPVPISPDVLLKAVKKRKEDKDETVLLDNNGNPVILRESNAFLDRLSELFAFGNIEPDVNVPSYFLPQVLQATDANLEIECKKRQISTEKYIEAINHIKNRTFPDKPYPEDVAKHLRHYQEDGLRWMQLMQHMNLGGILADEMGLGKTIQSLALINQTKTEKPALVIAPKTLVWSWDREISKFFPDMKRIVVNASSPESREKLWQTKTEMFITSYALVVNDFSIIQKNDFSVIILDEAQHIKNPKTKRFRSISNLKATCKIALTGTPIENHLSDLWSIFQFLMPGFLGKKAAIDRIEKTNDHEEYAKVSKMVQPFILRREKKDLLPELPPVIFKDYPVEMSEKQKEIYLSLLLRGRAEFLELGEGMNKIQILSLLTKLRLAANHPVLVSDYVQNFQESGKISILLELMDEIRESGGRVLIFSQFVKMLRIVEAVFAEKGISFLYMDGSTKNRKELVDMFNNGKGDAFLLSLKVGGFGLNLPTADNVIIIDPWWNPAVEEQAWSRAHRIGQDRQVVVSKLFSRETIEEKVLNIQQSKKGLTDFFMSKTLTEPSRDFIKMLAEMELKNNLEI